MSVSFLMCLDLTQGSTHTLPQCPLESLSSGCKAARAWSCPLSHIYCWVSEYVEVYLYSPKYLLRAHRDSFAFALSSQPVLLSYCTVSPLVLPTELWLLSGHPDTHRCWRYQISQVQHHTYWIQLSGKVLSQLNLSSPTYSGFHLFCIFLGRLILESRHISLPHSVCVCMYVYIYTWMC